jgi:hypothetical protein
MAEPLGKGGLVDTGTALHREVEVLAARFPQVEREELDRCVHETYAELEHDAEVQSHLVAVTRAQVTEKLRARGYEVHVRSEEAEEPEE